MVYFVGCFVDGLVDVFFAVLVHLILWLNVGHGFGTLFSRWFGRCLVWCNWWVVL